MITQRDLPPDHDHWLVRPANIRRLWILFIGLLALTIIPDLFIERHEEFGIDGTIGFFAWFGFGSCVIMVVAAKLLGFILKRKDVYYDHG